MLPEQDLTAIVLTIKLAAVTTVILLAIGTPLAWWLAHTRNRGKALFEAIVAPNQNCPKGLVGENTSNK